MEGFSWGGSEELWCKVADLAINEKQEVYISIKKWDVLPPKLQILANKGARIYQRSSTTKPESLFTRLIRKVFTNKRVNKWDFISAIQPDAICINMGGAYDIAYLPQLLDTIEKVRKPYYLIQQFNQENIVLQENIRVVARKAFKSACSVFFVSERNKNVTQRNLVMRIENGVVISNPANLKNCDEVPFPTNDSCINFANVARLDAAYKGQDLLLETLASDKWKQRNWKLNIFGEGPDNKYLQDLIDFFYLTGKVFLRGKSGDIANVWSEHHLLILPSIAEGTPLALIEAMICGRPSVVTNVGGNTEIVQDNRTGFVAQAPTVALIDEALERAWSQKNNWSNMGKQAHESIVKKLDLNSHNTIYSILIN